MPEWLHSLRLRLRVLLRWRHFDEDLQDELAFHLAMREEQFNRQWHVAVLIAAVLGGMVMYLYARGRSGLMGELPLLPEQQNTQDIGTLLYGGYLLPFEIASLLLLVAMVGAVVMAKKRI